VPPRASRPYLGEPASPSRAPLPRAAPPPAPSQRRCLLRAGRLARRRLPSSPPAAAIHRLEPPPMQATAATSIHAPSPTHSAVPRHRKPTGAPPPREAAAGRCCSPPTTALASLFHPGVHVGEIPSTSSSFSPPHSGPSQCRSPAPPGGWSSPVRRQGNPEEEEGEVSFCG
jgi:hypothetical protein